MGLIENRLYFVLKNIVYSFWNYIFQVILVIVIVK